MLLAVKRCVLLVVIAGGCVCVIWLLFVVCCCGLECAMLFVVCYVSLVVAVSCGLLSVGRGSRCVALCVVCCLVSGDVAL